MILSLLNNKASNNYMQQPEFRGKKNERSMSTGIEQESFFRRNIVQKNPMSEFFSPNMPDNLSDNLVYNYTLNPDKSVSFDFLFDDYIALFNNFYRDKLDYLTEKPVREFFKKSILLLSKRNWEEKIFQTLEDGGIKTTHDLRNFWRILQRPAAAPKNNPFYTNTFFNNTNDYFGNLNAQYGIAPLKNHGNYYPQIHTVSFFKDKEGHTDYLKALNIYSKLEHKNFINLYPQLLIDYHDYCLKSKKEFNPESIASFLTLIGCDSEYDINDNIFHIKKHFNNFETKKDKLEAIEYLASSCYEKLYLITKALLETGLMKTNITADDIYINNRVLIDELYIENEGDIGQQLRDMIDTLAAPYYNEKKDYNPRHNTRISQYYFKPNQSINDYRLFSQSITREGKIKEISNYETNINYSASSFYQNLKQSDAKSAETVNLYDIFNKSEYIDFNDISQPFISGDEFAKGCETRLDCNIDEIDSDDFEHKDEPDLSELKEVTLTRMLRYIETEKNLNNYFEYFSSCSKAVKDVPIALFNSLMISFDDDELCYSHFIQLINNLQLADIYTTYELIDFLKVYNSDENKTFERQGIEALGIYSKLEDKKDLAKYPEFLFDIYNFKGEDENFNPNTYLNFIKKLNLNNLDEIETKFSHLKDDFNDFETKSDKMNALDYLQATYNKKLDFIKQSNKKDINPEEIYSKYYNMIDILYKQNEGKSLSPLNSRMDLLVDLNKINNENTILKENFNDLQTVEDKIKLFSFLAENNLDIKDLNTVSNKQSILQNNDNLKNLTNKKPIITEISKQKKLKPDEIKKSIEQLPDIYNAVYNSGNFKTGDFENLIKFIKGFDIQSSSSILKLYNEVNLTKETKITSSKLRDFIKIMALWNEKAGINNYKKYKPEIKQFNRVREDIKKAVNFDIHSNTNLFSGKSLVEIYIENREEINKNPQNTLRILQDKIKGCESCLDKSDFYNLFGDSEKTYEFIFDNDIKSNSDEKEEQLFSNLCYSILSNIKDDKKLLEYFRKSDFFGKSKDYLIKKDKRYDEQFFTKDILNLIADKKISSIGEFDKFIETYKDKEGNWENIITSIKNLPDDVDFKEFNKILSSITEKLKTANIQFVKINNKNISNINIEAIKLFSNYTQTNLPYILANILAPEESKNFITKLPKALIENKKSNEYNSFSIADELTKLEDETQSYNRILLNLGLDKNSLGIGNDVKYSSIIKSISDMLPKNFVDFVNDDSYLKIGNKTANLSLHARLRLIERFGFENISSNDELYSKKNKEYLNNIIKSVYTETPIFVEGQEKGKIKILNKNLNVIFSKDGKMITIMKNNSIEN